MQHRDGLDICFRLSGFSLYSLVLHAPTYTRPITRPKAPSLAVCLTAALLHDSHTKTVPGAWSCSARADRLAVSTIQCSAITGSASSPDPCSRAAPQTQRGIQEASLGVTSRCAKSRLLTLPPAATCVPPILEPERSNPSAKRDGLLPPVTPSACIAPSLGSAL